MEEISVIIPGIPVPKGRPRFHIMKTREGVPYVHTYTPSETVKYEEMVSAYARQAIKPGTRPIAEKALKVEAVAYMPIPQSYSAKKVADAVAGYLKPIVKPDIDNLIKSALDACNGIVWADDNLICDLSIRKEYDVRPRLELKVSVIEPDIMGVNLL